MRETRDSIRAPRLRALPVWRMKTPDRLVRFVTTLRRHAVVLTSALILPFVPGCSVVELGVTSAVYAAAIPLFALQLLAGDVERFFTGRSAIPAGAALDTGFGRISVPIAGFFAQPGIGSANAVTLVSARGESAPGSGRFGGRFDSCAFPTPTGARTPREALYRQAEIAGQAHILRSRQLVSGAEVTWRGMRTWSFEAVLPVGLDGQPAWCRGMLVQNGGMCYFLARSVPLQSDAARNLDPASAEARRAREEFRGFAAGFKPNASVASSGRGGGTLEAGGALDLP